MPAAFSYFIAQHPQLVRSKPTWITTGALLLFVGASWAVVGGRAAADSPMRLLYPTSAVPVEMVDLTEYTVAEVVEGLPVGLRFEMLLKRTGVMQELDQAGTYTIFAPADNYFDYVEDGLPALTRNEERALAEQHVVPRVALVPGGKARGTYLTLGGQRVTLSAEGGVVWIGDKAFAIKGYYAENGVVYLISRVLTPQTATAAL